ncbi:MAG: HupE/UreJ family protein [Verrucomicrobiae bacterium]|nr:HupE/UreJ family protein [Verrucomicrobiae bacterium]
MLLLASVGGTQAHNPDTSYARITISPEAVEFKFSYDLVTLWRIAPLDANRDGAVSRAELEAATAVIQQFLRERIDLELNQRAADFAEALPPVWPEEAGEVIPQSDYHQRLVSFVFRNPVLTAPEDVALRFDVFDTFGPMHVVLGVFEWEGREQPVVFTRFEPDYLFDTGYRAPMRAQLAQYFRLGLKHIFLGYDHIAFLLGLLFVPRFLELVKVVTAFTVAHTITLGLAVLEVVKLPPRLVEVGIALTIMYVAVENLMAGSPRWRWLLTFAFGLVHGFGFASVLRELGLPARGLAQALVSFNLGVEAGQLLIVCALWPLVWWLGKQAHAQTAKVGVSTLILVLGAGWFVERLLGLGFMPI